MDGQNYVVFHNDGNDSYMNSTANFRGADVGTTFIDLYFASASVTNGTGHDKVRLTITATKEELALEDVGAAMAGAKNPVMVVADDINSLYISDHISGIASITLAAQASYKTVETIMSNRNGDSPKSDRIEHVVIFYKEPQEEGE